MKTINVNLNVNSIPESNNGAIVCPRINVFEHPIVPQNITKIGNYKYSFNMKDDGIYGVDIFTWRNNIVNIDTELKVVLRIAGSSLDQIHRRINIKEAGDYDISINIT